METFIVRFYRRALDAADDAAGTVEHVGSGRRAGFSGERELLERLLGARTLPEDSVDAGNPPPER
jgi:hypothetical protein